MKTYLREVWARIPAEGRAEGRLALLIGVVGWGWFGHRDIQLCAALALILWANNLQHH